MKADSDEQQFIRLMVDSVAEMHASPSPDGDVFDGATGDYGRTASNPVPCKGIFSGRGAESYLESLRTPDGLLVKAVRLGSTGSPVTNGKIVDIYDLTGPTGHSLGQVFICPYAARNSTTAPKGLRFATQLTGPKPAASGINVNRMRRRGGASTPADPHMPVADSKIYQGQGLRSRNRVGKLAMAAIVFTLVGTAGYFVYERFQHTPISQTRLGGVALGATEADLKFAKGAPAHESPTEWIYSYVSTSPYGIGKECDRWTQIFSLREGRVVSASVRDNRPGTNGDLLERICDLRATVTLDRAGRDINFEWTPEDATEALGSPTRICEELGGLRRTYVYDSLNLYIAFEAPRTMQSFGVFNGKQATPPGCST